MLIDFKALLADAIKNHHIVAFFEAWEQYSLEAVIEAAEELRLPVIAGFGESVINLDWFDARGIEEVAGLSRIAAERSTAQVGLIFNEVATLEHCDRGMRAGFNAVMLDSGHLPYEEHTLQTSQLVSIAHPLGVGVEAELGELPMASSEGMGDHKGMGHGGALTDPSEARSFVKETGIDALSVAVGNVHLMTNGAAELNTDLLGEIYQATGIPLVLHGGSGLPEAELDRMKQLGVAKINIGTILKQRFLDGIKDAIAESDERSTIHTRMGSRANSDALNRGKQYMKEEVRRRLLLYTR